MTQQYLLKQPTAGLCRYQLAVMNRYFQANGGMPGKSMWVELNLNSWDAIIYYDSAAQTFRIVGSIAVLPIEVKTLAFEVVQPGPLSANVSVDFSWPDTLFFDSGEVKVEDNRIQFTPPPIPIFGRYKIVTGGENLTGIFNNLLVFQTVVVPVKEDGQNLILDQNHSNANLPGYKIVEGLVSNNGMNFDLVGGIDDQTYNASWSLQSVTVSRI